MSDHATQVFQPAMEARPLSGRRFYSSTKRCFDLVLSAVGLVLLLPIGLLIGLLIKLSDGGPVFYRQTRIGQFGRSFQIRKFRSMVVNADRLGLAVTKEGDPRITRLGRFLRKTKLDELPQLWNVLIGEMSLVGPRPEVPRYVEMYSPEQRQILNYKPGITDVATMLFRDEEGLLRGAADVEQFYARYCLPKKIQLNLEHEARASLADDLWVIVQTLCPYWLGVLLVYAVALTLSFWLSFQLQSDFRMIGPDYAVFKLWLPWIVFPQLILLFWRGQMRGLISYFSIPEMKRTATALVLAFALQLGLCAFAPTDAVPTHSLLLIHTVLSFVALCGVRMGFRLLREHSAKAPSNAPAAIWRVAIIGTGELGTNLALELIRSKIAAYRVVAFFDDDPRTWQKRPHDIPVVGMPECLLNQEWQNEIDEVMVALPTTETDRPTTITELLKSRPFKVTVVSRWSAPRSIRN